MKKNIVVGIDIGTASLHGVVCLLPDGKNGLTAPTIIAAHRVDNKGMKQGSIVHSTDVAKKIGELLAHLEQSIDTKIRSVTLSVGSSSMISDYGIGTSVVTRADAVITSLDIEKSIIEAEKTIEKKNKRIVHTSIIECKVDGKEVIGKVEGTQGLKLESKVLFISVNEQHISELEQIFSSLKISIGTLIPSPLAVAPLITTDIQRNFGCICIDIGAETTTVALFENGTCSTAFVGNIGSSAITKDLALGLRIDPVDAENLKCGAVSFQSIPKKKVDEIVEARISDIFSHIDKYLKKIGRSGLLPGGAIITGGGSDIHNVELIAKNVLRIPAKKGLFAMPAEKGIQIDHRYLVAYGVACYQTDEHDFSREPLTKDGFFKTIKDLFKQLMP
jgi:cell division protein FtsA